jgi:hypothetical protein
LILTYPTCKRKWIFTVIDKDSKEEQKSHRIKMHAYARVSLFDCLKGIWII